MTSLQYVCIMCKEPIYSERFPINDHSKCCKKYGIKLDKLNKPEYKAVLDKFLSTCKHRAEGYRESILRGRSGKMLGLTLVCRCCKGHVYDSEHLPRYHVENCMAPSGFNPDSRESILQFESACANEADIYKAQLLYNRRIRAEIEFGAINRYPCPVCKRPVLEIDDWTFAHPKCAQTLRVGRPISVRHAIAKYKSMH